MGCSVGVRSLVIQPLNPQGLELGREANQILKTAAEPIAPTAP